MRNFANLNSPVGARIKYGFFSSYFVMTLYLVYSISSLIGPLSDIQALIFEQFLFIKGIAAFLYFFLWSILFAVQFYTVQLLISSLIVTSLTVIFFNRRNPGGKSVSLFFSNCFFGIPVGILMFVLTTALIPLISLVFVVIIEMLLGRIRG